MDVARERGTSARATTGCDVENDTRVVRVVPPLFVFIVPGAPTAHAGNGYSAEEVSPEL
jgi:hypothetical protein